MWIIPDNYLPSSLFVQDMLESKEDLSLPELNIESSLMWRSKPSPLPTWLKRWKTVTWLPHLSGRILKPSRRTYFEEQLTLSLQDIRASRFLPQGTDTEKMTHDIYGRSSTITSPQSILDGYFSRTSKDTSRLDSPQSSAIWKHEITTRRGEYSARLKQAQSTRENASTLWLTPRATEITESYATYRARMAASGNPKNVGKVRPANLSMQVGMWATPNTMDHLPNRSPEATVKMATGARKGRNGPSNLREQVHPENAEIYQAVKNWPTPSARDHKGGYLGGRIRDGKVSRDTLDAAVQYVDNPEAVKKHLSPDWVEGLMGLPLGWTDLGSWE